MCWRRRRRLTACSSYSTAARRLPGPADGCSPHGAFCFGSGGDAVRRRPLAARPAVSAGYIEGDDLAVTVHGRAELFEVLGPDGAEFRQAMLDHYLPLQGPAFEAWLNEADPIGARITADRMFTYASNA